MTSETHNDSENTNMYTTSQIQTTDVRSGLKNEDNEKTAQQETMIMEGTDTMAGIISISGQETTVKHDTHDGLERTKRDEHDITNCEESTAMNNDKTDPQTDNQVLETQKDEPLESRVHNVNILKSQHTKCNIQRK